MTINNDVILGLTQENELLGKSYICYVGLGSNLHDPRAQVIEALGRIAAIENVTLQKQSQLMHTKPLGPIDQPDFINAVAECRTTLTAEELFQQLQQIESVMGRKRIQRWGPRIIDLDLLLYADERIDLPHLQVPHSEMLKRDFVLQPLAEVNPKLVQYLCRSSHHEAEGNVLC